MMEMERMGEPMFVCLYACMPVCLYACMSEPCCVWVALSMLVVCCLLSAVCCLLPAAYSIY
jgi:hypothetical protein